MTDITAALAAVAESADTIALLTTALVLGIRHGIDWDHIAAITDITSTTAAADAAEVAHEAEHHAGTHDHPHGGTSEIATHLGQQRATQPEPPTAAPVPRARFASEQRHAIALGTLYALGHGAVVAVLGLAALLFGSLLPDWVDPIMTRVVGITLIVLGVWVFYSVYAYARHGTEFQLRSRWMIVFAGIRYAWRRFRARLHGHDHVEPLEASSYGARTAFGVGMIHGIGAETGSQVLIISAVGGAAGIGLGVPMMLAFILGLLLSNSAIIVITATGFVASQFRQRIYLAVGVVAGVFSLVVGLLFLFEADTALPDLGSLLGFLGGT